MAEKTGISWTDSTFNPWIGCVKVAAGCAHCYAEAFAKRTGKAKWGADGTRVKTSEKYWREPVKWNAKVQRSIDAFKAMEKQGHERSALLAQGFILPNRPRVFCASMADVFEEWNKYVVDHRGELLYDDGDGGVVPSQAGFGDIPGPAQSAIGLNTLRRMLFALIDATPNLDWLLLTKRPENVRRMWLPTVVEYKPAYVSYGEIVGPDCREEWNRRNVWLGTSIAERRDLPNIDALRKSRDLAPVLFLSVEPLIEDLGTLNLSGIDWVILGCESRGRAVGRFSDGYEDAARDIIEQCRAAGVAVFNKQTPVDGFVSHEPNDWPEDLRVREFPTVNQHG